VPREVDDLARKTGDAAEDVLLKALTFYEVATDPVKKRQRLALPGPDYRFIREIVGRGQPDPERNSPRSL